VTRSSAHGSMPLQLLPIKEVLQRHTLYVAVWPEMSELKLQSELILTRVVIRIVVGDRSEGGVSKLCVSTAQGNNEAGRVAQVEGLSGELQVGALRHRELLGESDIDVTEVGPEERVALYVADCAGRLRNKCRGVEEIM
jgi:hypothetical protein